MILKRKINEFNAWQYMGEKDPKLPLWLRDLRVKLLTKANDPGEQLREGEIAIIDDEFHFYLKKYDWVVQGIYFNIPKSLNKYSNFGIEQEFEAI